MEGKEGKKKRARRRERRGEEQRLRLRRRGRSKARGARQRWGLRRRPRSTAPVAAAPLGFLCGCDLAGDPGGAAGSEKQVLISSLEIFFLTFSLPLVCRTQPSETKLSLLHHPSSSSLSFSLLDPACDAREPPRAASEVAKEKKSKRSSPTSSIETRKTMAEEEALDARELALNAAAGAAAKPLTINDLPNDQLVCPSLWRSATRSW